jgi:hypothetical protein
MSERTMSAGARLRAVVDMDLGAPEDAETIFPVEFSGSML